MDNPEHRMTESYEISLSTNDAEQFIGGEGIIQEYLTAALITCDVIHNCLSNGTGRTISAPCLKSNSVA